MRFALIAFLILLMAMQTATAFEMQKSIKAVAVTSGERVEGVVIEIKVMINPGNGRVFVSTTPFTEIDMQGSAQLAALTACDLLGIDFTKYDFFYIIEADSPIVGGPSAGAVMTVATIAALKGLDLNEDVYMSGMVYPDGSIGPVGGLNYKLEAVAKNSGKIFLIPSGQSVITVEEKKIRKIGIVSIITTELKELDLVEYGKKLGVQVFEVRNVNEALLFYTGYEIVKREGKLNITIYSDELRRLAEKMKKSLEELQGYETKEARELIRRAEENYLLGNYYTATSLLFQAKILMRYEMYRKTLVSSHQIEYEMGRIEEEISRLKDFLRDEPVGINSIQIIAGAQERIAEASNALEKAKVARSDEGIFYNLAYARERLESAKVWLSLLQQIKDDYSLNSSEIKKRAEFYINQANSIIVYAYSLEGYQELLDSASESLKIAKSLYSESLYAGSAFAALNAIVDASLSIEAKYDAVAKVEEKRRNAEAAIAEAEEICYPILPIAYFEFAENSNTDYAKLLYYSLSEKIAKFLLNMANAKEKKEIIRREYVETMQTIQRPVGSVKKVLEAPGFEAILATIAVLLAYRVRRR
uniref:Serine protease-like protein n=1 Tax=Archaeoglobus fulgidus TaxID=2234 RepID=A0A7J2TJD7_ARCFL